MAVVAYTVQGCLLHVDCLSLEYSVLQLQSKVVRQRMSVELRDLEGLTDPVSSVLASLGAPQPQGPWPSKSRSPTDSPSNYYLDHKISLTSMPYSNIYRNEKGEAYVTVAGILVPYDVHKKFLPNYQKNSNYAGQNDRSDLQLSNNEQLIEARH